MLIGIISDTHDRLEAMAKAVSKLNELKVETVIHCGDFISPFVIRELGKLNCKLIGVFGNNDGDKYTLTEKFSSLGFQLHDGPHAVEIDGLRFLILHGYRSPELTINIAYKLAETGKYDIVAYGHTHKYDQQKIGDALVLNPGEVCGYLTHISTIMILDTKKMEVTKITL